jgi:hypothetical protein
MAFTFYIGHDNALEWVLKLERPNCSSTVEYIDADTATGFEVSLDDEAGSTFDSATYPDVFDTASVLIGADTVVALAIKLGLAPNIAAGTYRMRLVVFSLDYPNGVVWQNNVPIVVKE